MRCFEMQTNIVQWIIVRNRINGDEFGMYRKVWYTMVEEIDGQGPGALCYRHGE